MGARKKTAKRSYGALLIEALEEAVAVEHGLAAPARVTRLTARQAAAEPAPAFTGRQIIALRTAIGFSQALFADALNVSAETVRSWEQDRRPPSGAAQRLLELAARHPEWLRESVASRSDPATRADARTQEFEGLAASVAETLRITRDSHAILVAQITTTLNSASQGGRSLGGASLFAGQPAGTSISDEQLERPVH